MTLSLRARLILGTASSIVLILVLSGIGIDRLVRRSLLAEFDDAMLAKARALASTTEQKRGRVQMEFDMAEMPEFATARHPEYYQVYRLDGSTIARSPSLGTGNLAVSPTAVLAKGQAIRLPDGQSGRAIAWKYSPRLEEEGEGEQAQAPAVQVIVAVARHTRELEATLGRIRRLLALVGGLATVASAGLMIFMVRQGLRPVDRLATRIAHVGEGRLPDRLALHGTPGELAPVVDRLNELLGRLERAFARERSLTADVAHELRTPLAGLASAMEVCLTRRRNPEEYERTLGRCLAITRQTHGMVDNLLTLARAEAGQLALTAELVALTPLLQECWSLFADRAKARHLEVRWPEDANHLLKTDREKLRLVLHNVLDNAVCYADEGGMIRVEAACQDGHLALAIANTGSHVPSADAERVFDRFWRADAARPETGVHCGLGLSLCRKVVEAMGGAITVQSQDGGEFQVILQLSGCGNPATAPSAQAPGETE